MRKSIDFIIESHFAEISREVTPGEYKNVVDEAGLLELNNGWLQKGPAKTDPRFMGTNIQQKREDETA